MRRLASSSSSSADYVICKRKECRSTINIELWGEPKHRLTHTRERTTGIIVKRLTAELKQSKASAGNNKSIRFPWSTWKRIYGRSWLERLYRQTSLLYCRPHWMKEINKSRVVLSARDIYVTAHYNHSGRRISRPMPLGSLAGSPPSSFPIYDEEINCFRVHFQLHIVRAPLASSRWIESQVEQTLVEDILAIVKQYLLLIIYDSGLITALNRFLCDPLPRQPPHAHGKWERTKITINIVGIVLVDCCRRWRTTSTEKNVRKRSAFVPHAQMIAIFFFSPLVSFFLLLPQPPSLSPSPAFDLEEHRKARRIEGNHTQPVCGEHIKIKS